jgi:DNA-binding LacI/PurR family transcriptional regulator
VSVTAQGLAPCGPLEPTPNTARLQTSNLTAPHGASGNPLGDVVSIRPLEKRPRVTITDLAEMLGMDKSSVSLALRDSPKVSVATRARVRQAAAEHHYIPNWAAKRLAGSSDHAVGLVMPSAFGCLTDPPVVRTAQALAKLAANRQLTLNLMAQEQLAEANGDNSVPLHADGLLVWGDVPAPAALRFSSAYGRPSIVLDPHHPSYAKYKGNTIAIDNHGGAAALVTHLRERGAKRLTFVQVEDQHLSHIERWKGTRETWHALAEDSTLSKLSLEELTDSKLRELAQSGDAAIACVGLASLRPLTSSWSASTGTSTASWSA